VVERPLGCFGRGLIEGVEFCVEDPNAEKVMLKRWLVGCLGFFAGIRMCLC